MEKSGVDSAGSKLNPINKLEKKTLVEDFLNIHNLKEKPVKNSEIGPLIQTFFLNPIKIDSIMKLLKQDEFTSKVTHQELR